MQSAAQVKSDGKRVTAMGTVADWRCSLPGKVTVTLEL